MIYRSRSTESAVHSSTEAEPILKTNSGSDTIVGFLPIPYSIIRENRGPAKSIADERSAGGIITMSRNDLRAQTLRISMQRICLALRRFSKIGALVLILSIDAGALTAQPATPAVGVTTVAINEAAALAAKLRFRAIMMTSLVFIMSLVPLSGHRALPRFLGITSARRCSPG